MEKEVKMVIAMEEAVRVVEETIIKVMEEIIILAVVVGVGSEWK